MSEISTYLSIERPIKSSSLLERLGSHSVLSTSKALGRGDCLLLVKQYRLCFKLS